MPALTFIIPAFNVASTIGDTLQSLLAQTRQDWTAIVVDDGAADQTHAAASAFTHDPRIKIVRQENRGLSGARNRGMAECQTEGAAALCFLDADDVVEPRFAEIMLEALGDSFDLAACWYRIVGPNLEDLSWIVRTGDHDMAPARLIEYNPYAPGAIVVHRRAAERALVQTPYGPGLFDTSLNVHEDWDAWMRLGAFPPLGAGAKWASVVSEPLFGYRQRAGSMSGQLDRMWRAGLELIANAPIAAELKPGALRRWTVRHLARATARGDAELVAACFERVEPLAQDELELLAGSLRWSFCQQEQVGPMQVEPWREELWGQQIARILEPRLCGIAARFATLAATAPAAIVEKLDRALGPDDTLVVYGVGRNGRDLFESLSACGWKRRITWMDDDPAAVSPPLNDGPALRINLDDLTPSHFIIITPDRHDPIIRRLARSGVQRIETLSSLMGAAGTAHP